MNKINRCDKRIFTSNLFTATAKGNTRGNVRKMAQIQSAEDQQGTETGEPRLRSNIVKSEKVNLPFYDASGHHSPMASMGQ